MEYNTSRGDMKYREYGRTVSKIIDKVCSQPDGDEKDEATNAIIYVMAQVSGVSVRDDVSLHKLWNHLMILSNFRLEHAWPFTLEELEALKERAASSEEHVASRLPYKNTVIDKRHYGAYLESMLQKLKETPDGEEYDALAEQIAQQTKRSYLVWNGDLSDDNIIVEQLVKMSGDERLKEKLWDKSINVPHNTLPLETTGSKKKKKKK